MAPIRRYLRITKYSVLEVRIYLETPSLAETWLLRQPDPALPRIIEAVRPLVLPKLREENERSKGKGKTKKGVRDVVSQGTRLPLDPVSWKFPSGHNIVFSFLSVREWNGCSL